MEEGGDFFITPEDRTRANWLKLWWTWILNIKLSERVTGVELQNCVQIGQQSNDSRATENEPGCLKLFGGRVISTIICNWSFTCFCGPAVSPKHQSHFWLYSLRFPLLWSLVLKGNPVQSVWKVHSSELTAGPSHSLPGLGKTRPSTCSILYRPASVPTFWLFWISLF